MQKTVYKYRGYVAMEEPYIGERLIIIDEFEHDAHVKSLDRDSRLWLIDKRFLVDEDAYIVPRGYCKFKYLGQERYGFLLGYGIRNNTLVAEVRSGEDELSIKPELVEEVPLNMVYFDIHGNLTAIAETPAKYIFKDADECIKMFASLVFTYEGEIYYYRASERFIRMVKNPSAKFRYCTRCGKLHPFNAFDVRSHDTYSSVERVCINCVTKLDLVLCEHCYSYHPRSEVDGWDGHFLCKRCVDSLYPKCEKCGERHHYLDYIYIENNRYCLDCLKTIPNLKQCAHCNSYFISKAEGDSTESMYCKDCLRYASEYAGDILDYHEPYILPFLGSKNELRMGVELEIDYGGEDNCNSKKVYEAIGKLNAVMMHDGSLDGGFEIVSAPATLEAHTEIIDWRAAMKKAINLGYRSHKTCTCGMHVHVDRAYFKDKNDSLIYEDKFAMLFANNVEWIKKYSRREHWDYCGIEDAAAVKTTRADAEQGICKAKPYKGGSHHVAINYGTNKPTIEIRIFRGTLSHPTFIGRLQFVQLFCDFVKHTPFADLADIQMEDFINEAKTRGYSEFITNMKALNIYKEE